MQISDTIKIRVLALCVVLALFIVQLPMMLYSVQYLELLSSADLFIALEMVLAAGLLVTCFFAKSNVYLVNLLLMILLLLDLAINRYFPFTLDNPFYSGVVGLKAEDIVPTIRFHNRDYISMIAIAVASIVINMLAKSQKQA